MSGYDVFDRLVDSDPLELRDWARRMHVLLTEARLNEQLQEADWPLCERINAVLGQHQDDGQS